jgi:hypothetical protein
MIETLSRNTVPRSPEELAHQRALVRAAQHAVEVLATHVPVLGSGTPAIARAIREFIGTALLPPLAAGVPLVELLGALARPLEEDAPAPAEPWARYLPLSIDEFLRVRVTLEVFVPAWQRGFWLGPDAVPGWVPKWGSGIWGGDQMHRELAEAGVPAPEHTIERLVQHLGAQVRKLWTTTP